MKAIIKWFNRYFGDIQKALLWILLIVVVYIVLTDVKLRDLCPEESFWEYFVNCIYALGLSYIVSFIFYFIQVHLKEKKEKDKILPSVSRLFEKLLRYMNDIPIDIVSKYSTLKPHNISEISQESFMESISIVRFDLGSDIYQGDKELSWLEYFTYRQKQIEECRRIILDYAQYLDEECISLLADIRDDQILYVMVPNANLCQEAGIDSSFNLSGTEPYCYQLFLLIIRLNEYYDKVLKSYSKTKEKPIVAIYKGAHKQVIL